MDFGDNCFLGWGLRCKFTADFDVGLARSEVILFSGVSFLYCFPTGPPRH